MTRTLKIDFVSDIVCPWCAVGLGGLTQALETLKAEGIEAKITFRPFELNPDMAPEGENIVDHIGRKYGASPEQSAANRETIRVRAAEVGFDMRMTDDSRIWNTFDAHRLLHWAGETAGPEAQRALKKALFYAHFTENRNLTDAGVLTTAPRRRRSWRPAATPRPCGRNRPCGAGGGSTASRPWWWRGSI